MAARALHALVAVLAIAFVAGAAWGASLVAARVFPAPQDDRFAPRGMVVRSKPGVHHPQDEADCVTHGGQWLPFIGFSQTPGCVMPNADAGRVCTDSIQCEGLCVAPDDTKEGARVPGRCTDHRPTLGCQEVVSNGRAWTICYD